MCLVPQISCFVSQESNSFFSPPFLANTPVEPLIIFHIPCQIQLQFCLSFSDYIPTYLASIPKIFPGYTALVPLPVEPSHPQVKEPSPSCLCISKEKCGFSSNLSNASINTGPENRCEEKVKKRGCCNVVPGSGRACQASWALQYNTLTFLLI